MRPRPRRRFGARDHPFSIFLPDDLGMLAHDALARGRLARPSGRTVDSGFGVDPSRSLSWGQLVSRVIPSGQARSRSAEPCHQVSRHLCRLCDLLMVILLNAQAAQVRTECVALIAGPTPSQKRFQSGPLAKPKIPRRTAGRRAVFQPLTILPRNRPPARGATRSRTQARENPCMFGCTRAASSRRARPTHRTSSGVVCSPHATDESGGSSFRADAGTASRASA